MYQNRKYMFKYNYDEQEQTMIAISNQTIQT